MTNKSFDLLTSRTSLVILILTIGLLPLFLIYGGFYIFGDSTTQMLPFLYETKRMFSSGMPLWSWNTYAGQDFLYSYAYYTTTNPFVWINCLFPYSLLGLGFTVTIYLKVLACAYIAQLYFRKMGLGDRLSLVGALLYTFSSWAMTAMYYYMFLDPMILFPLLLISIERYLNGDSHRYTGIAAATFLVVWINYYFTPGTLIAASIYFFCRLASKPEWRHRWINLTVRAMLSVALGIALAAIVLVPVYFILHGSPRSALTQHFDWFSLPERFLSVVFPKISEGETPFILVTSFYNINAAYVVVFGILGSVLMLIRRKSWINWLFIIYIVIYLTPLNGILSLFTSTEYTRWAYALVLVIVLAMLYYIKDYGFPNRKPVNIYIIACAALFALTGGVSALWHIKSGMPMPETFRLLMYVSGLVLLNLGCLYYLSRTCGTLNKDAYRRMTACIAICAAAQLAGFSLWASRTGIISAEKSLPISPAMDYEQESAESGFTERIYLSGADFSRGLANRGLMLGIPGTQAFNSVRNSKMYDLNVYVDTTDERYLSFTPSVFKDSYGALMSLRRSIPADSLNKVTDIEAATELPYYIPMGMAYDRYQLDDSVRAIIKRPATIDVPLMLLSAIAISADDEADFARYIKKTDEKAPMSSADATNNTENIADSVATGQSEGKRYISTLDSVVQARRRNTADFIRGDSRGLSAHIDLDAPSAVFFSFPAEEGFKATDNGNPTKIYNANLGMTALLLDTGSHDIRFDYRPVGATAGLWISFIALIITALIFFKEKKEKE